MKDLAALFGWVPDLEVYLSALRHEWGVAAAALFPWLADLVASFFAKDWKQRIFGRLTDQTALRIKMAFVLLAALFIGFSAWRDEYHQRLKLSGDLADLRRHPVTVTLPPKVVFQPARVSPAPSVPLVPGPLTASDLPLLYAVALPGKVPGVLRGQLYPDASASRKSPQWMLSIRTRGLPVAKMVMNRPEDDQGELIYSTKIDDAAMTCSSCALNLWFKPRSIEEFKHTQQTIHVKYRSDNGQVFEQDLPIKILSGDQMR